MHRTFPVMLALAALASLGGAAPAGAVSLTDMKGLESLHGRYAPKGDCTTYPQVVIDAAGFALDQGQGRIERANRPEYAISFFGPEYEGSAHAFFPYWDDANGTAPFLLTVDPGLKPAALAVEGHDYGWKGGPPMPARYQPWLAGSPYVRCATD